MKRAIILSTLLLTLVQSYGQTDTIWEDEQFITDTDQDIVEPPDTAGIYEVFQVEHPAEFPGGESALTKFIHEHYRIPELAREAGVEGLVLIHFVIDTNGYATDVVAEPRKAKLGYGLEEEGVRVVKSMPRWTPATSRGKKMRMRYRVPIRIRFE